MKRKEIVKALRQFIHQFDGRDVEGAFVEDVLEAAADMLEQDAHFDVVGKMVYCKNCAHLEYEDLGIYYCGLHRIAGQLNPDDQCSCGKRKEEQRNATTD